MRVPALHSDTMSSYAGELFHESIPRLRCDSENHNREITPNRRIKGENVRACEEKKWSSFFGDHLSHGL